jgi:hypothetical protein
LDSWDGHSYSERRTARTRISINVGRTTRHLLALDITLPEAGQLVKAALGLRHPPPPSRLIPLIFLLFPEIPVVRLEIRPGEAYVADTDNIIHDASTVLSSEEAFHCSFRGHWKLPI